METSLNVIDYPEPKEQKCYVFECECSCKGTITIYADSLEKAKARFDSKDYDDMEYKDYEIESVVGVRNE